jgi:hypothetical protein
MGRSRVFDEVGHGSTMVNFWRPDDINDGARGEDSGSGYGLPDKFCGSGPFACTDITLGDATPIDR